MTPVDQRVVMCQTVHERPLVGGVTARLIPKVLDSYRADPLLVGWLRLSGTGVNAGGEPLPGRSQAAERLAADRIAFVMLNRATASQDLKNYVERVLPLTLIAEEDNRSLYVTSPRTLR